MFWLSGTARRRYPSEEYPEDVAFQRLVEWGFRGNFAIRWANGNVATYKRIPWPEIDAKELMVDASAAPLTAPAPHPSQSKDTIVSSTATPTAIQSCLLFRPLRTSQRRHYIEAG